ncbi:MAG: TfoX/Sxy family protein [Balneolaceae bacterium]|nr:TfoX/Sxy family protein [Balneolaceae bacterium]
MAYDEGLAQRVREQLRDQPDVEEKKMFGGLCFMVSGHMCCGILENRLMARVGAEQYEECLLNEYARPMDFTGKPMKGMLYIEAGGLQSDEDLKSWIDTCLNFIKNLPPKK